MANILQDLGSRLIQLCLLAVLVSGIYVAGVCIYRLTLHPYAKYPGPILAKVSNLYAAYHAWRGDIHLDMWRVHEKYGNHVRYAPNRLLVNTIDGLQNIYGHRSNVRKSTAYKTMVHRAPNTLTTLDKKAHGHKRRVISQGFSDASLRSLDPAIFSQVQKFCTKLSEPKGDDSSAAIWASEPNGWSPPRNMSDWCNYLAFDIMGSVIFSGKYDTLGKPDDRWVIGAIEQSNVRVSVLFQAPLVSIGKLDRYLFPAAIAARNRFIPFVTRILRERLQRKEQLEKSGREPEFADIFSFLAKATDPETGKGFGLAELGAETTTLIVAGSDTSSTAMAATLFYLCRYPHAYEKVTKEVRDHFNSADEIHAGPILSSCKYLRACIDETLRISPSAGSALWREALKGGAAIDGIFIPEGYDVGVCVYAIQHNPAYYPDPFRYSPERWLSNDDSFKSAQNAHTPFSIGPRGCIGKSLAIMELMMTIAMVVYIFDFKVAEGEEVIVHGPDGAMEQSDEFQLKDHITAAKNGPVLQFRRR